MDKKIKNIIGCLLLICSLSNAQKTRKAARNFDDHSFVNAIASYEDLVKKGYSNTDIYEKLGNANFKIGAYKKAGAWYEKLFSLTDTSIKPEYMHRYALTLKTLGDYEKSDLWMQRFRDNKPTDSRALQFDANRDYLVQIGEYSRGYSIKNLALNSKESDFAPSLYGAQLIFSSARDSGIVTRRIHLYDNTYFQTCTVPRIRKKKQFLLLPPFRRS